MNAGRLHLASLNFQAKANRALEQIVKTGADALNGSGGASRKPPQELAEAYRDLAPKDEKTLTAAIQALTEVKSPAEFIELQQRQIGEGVLDALVDGTDHDAPSGPAALIGDLIDRIDAGVSRMTRFVTVVFVPNARLVH